jgi:hypothetical protein
MGILRHLGLIRAHHSFIDPMTSFEEIMRHMPQLNNTPEAYKSGS